MDQPAHFLLKKSQRSCANAPENNGHSNLVGVSLAVARLRQIVEKIAPYEVDVLIIGETGTGKELVARSLHDQSRRGRYPFVALNCCALPESIMESELFGHEMGAFTGADRRRIGKFEFANGGTIFLDEIDSMPVHLQAKLLRVLQERVVQRVGSNETTPLDIRVLAATKVDLKEASSQGRFREDLFHRLSVVNIYLTPLRQRLDDILPLFRHFVRQACSRYQLPQPGIPEDMIEKFMALRWPGNVRELKNAAERFTLGCDEVQQGNSASPAACFSIDGPAFDEQITLPERVQAFEKTQIEQTLIHCRGNIKAALACLGLPRKTLYDKLRKYNLDRKNYLGQ